MSPADIRGRINGASVFEDLKVDMGSGRPARAAHEGDHITPTNEIT
jgi:hypothetical protein